jgi:hypothetical protein
MSDSGLIDERWILNGLEGSGSDLIELLSKHFSWSQKKAVKSSARVADVPIDFETTRLQACSGLEGHGCNNFGVQHFYWRLKSSEMWGLDWWIVPNVSEDISASIFRNKQSKNSVCFLDFKDEGITIVRNVLNCLLVDIA